MLTKQEQGILDNAPDGMDFYITHSVTGGNLGYCRRGERSKDFYVCHSLADLREKQRKTVVDAVNAWGEFELAPSSGVETFRYCPADDSIMGCHYKAEASDGFVCTIEEFNQCVKEMSFHNVSSAEFMDYQLGVKIPLEPIKPRIKVEYVKVDASVAVYWFGEGDLYQSPTEGEPVSIQDYINALVLGGDDLYRKVETEIKTESRWLTYEESSNTFTPCREDQGAAVGFQIIEITVEV